MAISKRLCESLTKPHRMVLAVFATLLSLVITTPNPGASLQKDIDAGKKLIPPQTVPASILNIAVTLRAMGREDVAAKLIKDFERRKVIIADPQGGNATTDPPIIVPGITNRRDNIMTLNPGVANCGANHVNRNPVAHITLTWALTIIHEYVHMDQDNPLREPRFENSAWRATIAENQSWMRRVMSQITQAESRLPNNHDKISRITNLTRTLNDLRDIHNATLNGLKDEIAEGNVGAGLDWPTLDFGDTKDIDQLIADTNALINTFNINTRESIVRFEQEMRSKTTVSPGTTPSTANRTSTPTPAPPSTTRASPAPGKAPPACAYQYSAWGACDPAAKKQTRTVAGKEPAGCVDKSPPVLEQLCDPGPANDEKKLAFLNCLCIATPGGMWWGGYAPEECAKERPGAGPCSASGPSGGYSCRPINPHPPSAIADCYRSNFHKEPDAAGLVSAKQMMKEGNKKNSKPLAVAINPGPGPIIAAYGSALTLTAAAEGGAPGYAYSWTGTGDGKGSTFTFLNARAPGSFTVSVTVTDSSGTTATASVKIEVEALTVKIEKTTPAGNLVAVGGEATFTATVMSGGKPASGSYRIQWQPHPEVEFNPFEDANQTTAIFREPGTFHVWAQALQENGAVYSTVGESEQIAINVEAPQWRVDVKPASPFIGQEVTAVMTPSTSPAPDMGEMNFRWRMPRNAKQTSTSEDDRTVTFTLTDTQPALIICEVGTRYKNQSLGEAHASLQASNYALSIRGPRPRMELMKWECDTQLGGARNCGMKKLENYYATGQEILFSAELANESGKPVDFAWSVIPNGCSIKPFGSDTSLTCQAKGDYAVVAAAKIEGMVVGRAEQRFTVTFSQDDVKGWERSKESAEKLKSAKDLSAQGKYREALAVTSESLRIDPGNIDAQELAAKLRNDLTREEEKKSQALALVDEGFKHEQEGNYEASIEKYRQANTVINDKKIADHVEELARKQAEMARVPSREAQIQNLISSGYALEKQGDISGAIAKYSAAQQLNGDPKIALHIEKLRAARDAANQPGSGTMGGSGASNAHKGGYWKLSRMDIADRPKGNTDPEYRASTTCASGNNSIFSASENRCESSCTFRNSTHLAARLSWMNPPRELDPGQTPGVVFKASVRESRPGPGGFGVPMASRMYYPGPGAYFEQVQVNNGQPAGTVSQATDNKAGFVEGKKGDKAYYEVFVFSVCERGYYLYRYQYDWAEKIAAPATRSDSVENAASAPGRPVPSVKTGPTPSESRKGYWKLVRTSADRPDQTESSGQGQFKYARSKSDCREGRCDLAQVWDHPGNPQSYFAYKVNLEWSRPPESLPPDQPISVDFRIRVNESANAKRWDVRFPLEVQANGASVFNNTFMADNQVHQQGSVLQKSDNVTRFPSGRPGEQREYLVLVPGLSKQLWKFHYIYQWIE